MPSRLTRYQKDGHYHAINFTCYRQRPWLQDDHSCIAFEETYKGKLADMAASAANCSPRSRTFMAGFSFPPLP